MIYARLNLQLGAELSTSVLFCMHQGLCNLYVLVTLTHHFCFQHIHSHVNEKHILSCLFALITEQF